jgi:hypothetical protein
MDALSRILASKAFAKSARLSAFLRHVCVTTLEGREKVLCEQHIGTAVFGRPDHYNPSEDTIVRSSARLLRQRLASYYEEEGRQDQLRISIPRGAYVPVFVATPPAGVMTRATPPQGAAASPAQSLPAAPPPAPAEAIAETLPRLPPAMQPAMSPVMQPALQPSVTPAPPASVAARARRWWWLAALVAVVVLVLWLALRGSAPALDASRKFWALMLPADRDTLLVIPDNGLVMYQGDLHRVVPLSDYIANRPGVADSPEAALSLAQYGARRYTAMSSVTLAAEMGKLATAAPERYHVRFARDVQLTDFKHDNTVIVGVEQSNPWWALFRNQFNFHIDWDRESGDFLVLNDHPAHGEQAAYPFSWRDPRRRGYALIGFKRNLNGHGHTLLLGGTTSAGTDAAIEFLLNPASMAPLMQQAQRSDGSIGEFEVLLQCVLQANGSTDIQLLGVRIKPP